MLDEFHDFSPENVGQIMSALERGNKIEAIKLYREMSGKGLKESKDFVDALVPQLVRQNPEKFGHLNQTASVGCSTKAIVLVGGFGLGIWVFRLLA